MTCDKNAECRNTLGSYNCHCKKGYYGNGQDCYNVNECVTGEHDCHENALCIDKIGSYSCPCKHGYKKEGTKCIDIDECEEGLSNCQQNSECRNRNGTFDCQCKKGFVKRNSISNICDDIDECSNKTSCNYHTSRCLNNIGSFQCICLDGYFKEGGKCHQCLLNSSCHEHGVCYRDPPLENRCQCKSGFIGNGTYCQDVDECKGERKKCSNGECRNHIGTYSCLCHNGFRAELANTKCIDIDECEESKDKGVKLCNGTYEVCQNVKGTYACVSK